MTNQTAFERKVNEMHSWMARVEQRMSTPREDWDDWTWEGLRFRTLPDTPVTPTVSTTSSGVGNASPSRPEGWFADTTEGEIEHRKGQIRRLLFGVDVRDVDDLFRVERELAASRIHHSIFDLIRGGPGIDRRDPAELEWERLWRTLPDGRMRCRVSADYPPTYAHRAIALGRDLDLHRQWQEIY